MEQTRIYVGGIWRATTATRMRALTDPATGETIGHAVMAGAEDADTVVGAARQALGAWSRTSGAERAEVLEAIAAAWEARGDEMARLVTREMGMPLSQSAFHNAAGPVGLLRYYAGIARGFEPEQSRTPFAFEGSAVVRRNPVGVVAA